MFWKSLRHSAPESFDCPFGGEVNVCWFVIIDDRLITVTAAGRKRTVELHGTPPLALAERIAAEMFQAAAQDAAADK